MPLRDELRGIGERISSSFVSGGEPPFIVYQYLPAEEWTVRRDLGELRRWLEAPSRGVSCASVSLADLFWEALEESSYLEELISQERMAIEASNGQALREVYAAVGEILREPPALPDRVVAHVSDCDERTCCVSLSGWGALPLLQNVHAARRPPGSPAPTSHFAVPRTPGWRVRPVVHGPH